MTKRERLSEKIKSNNAKIEALNAENKELYRNGLLLSDKKQWYKEGVEEHREGRKKVHLKVGRIYWNEDFRDEDTGELITIERSRAVRVNDEWINGN